MFARSFMGALALIMLAGCSATQNVSDAKNITLEKALVDTVDALSAAHSRSVQKKTNFGFYGCTVTAVFAVSATASQDNKLALTASGPPASIIPISLGANASTESTASGSRSNTVTVVLATKPCLANAKAQVAPQQQKPVGPAQQPGQGQSAGGQLQQGDGQKNPGPVIQEKKPDQN